MQDEVTIYLDLDETLFHTIYTFQKPSKKKRTWLKMDNVWYGSMERPKAKEIIEFCRGLAPTKVLTNSLREYAVGFTDAFDFGFKWEDLICRYDYLDEIEDGSMGYGWGPRITKIVKPSLNQPNAILIDNLLPTDEGARHKMQFLGINSSRYIQIREFLGKEPECFDLEWEIMQDKILELTNV